MCQVNTGLRRHDAVLDRLAIGFKRKKRDVVLLGHVQCHLQGKCGLACTRSSANHDIVLGVDLDVAVQFVKSPVEVLPLSAHAAVKVGQQIGHCAAALVVVVRDHVVHALDLADEFFHR